MLLLKKRKLPQLPRNARKSPDMPYYSFRCLGGHTFDAYAKIDSRDSPRDCPKCAAPVTRTLAAPAVRMFTPYISPVTGKEITSASARKDDLRRSGSIEWEPGIKQDLPRIRQANFEKAMAPIEATIDSTVAQLHASGQLKDLA